MKHFVTLLTAAAALAVSAPALAAPAPQGAVAKEARIPFANHGAIRDWRAVDRDTLLVRANGNRWYKIELMGPAHDLRFAQAIGFDTGPVGTLDRFSTVIVRGWRYPVTSVVEVPAPERKKA